MIYSAFIAVLTVLSINAVATASTIEPRVLEAQLWGNQYFFRIENLDLVKSADWAENERVVTNTNFFASSQNNEMNDELLDPDETDSTITTATTETFSAYEV